MSYVDALFDREADKISVVERREGKRYFTEYPARYVAYYDDPKGKYKSIYGNPVSRIATKQGKEFKREVHMQSGKRLYESDINPIFRCLEENYLNKDAPELQVAFFDRIVGILTAENIDFDKKVLLQLINKHFPDWRRVLNELQRYSVSGKIDSAILAEFTEVRVDDLIKTLRSKDFPAVRKWVVSNLDNDPSVLLRKVYDAMYSNLDGPSIAAAVLIIAKYQYQIAFVADQEINLLAALTEIMVECEFK